LILPTSRLNAPKSVLNFQTSETQMIVKRSKTRKNRPQALPTSKNRRHFGLRDRQMLNNLLTET
ncbi:MAG: hypothetical protein MSS87_01995, partial [Bacteroidales bacterium]|nr:hypothetical protein [Bacteroidales bacterium]